MLWSALLSLIPSAMPHICMRSSLVSRSKSAPEKFCNIQQYSFFQRLSDVFSFSTCNVRWPEMCSPHYLGHLVVESKVLSEALVVKVIWAHAQKASVESSGLFIVNPSHNCPKHYPDATRGVTNLEHLGIGGEAVVDEPGCHFCSVSRRRQGGQLKSTNFCQLILLQMNGFTGDLHSCSST